MRVRDSVFPGIILALTTQMAVPVSAQVFPAEVAEREGTIKLNPAGPWNVDYGDNKCRLQRVFESNGERHALIIEQNSPEQGFGLMISGSELNPFKRVKSFDLGLRTDLSLAPRERFRIGNIEGYGTAIIMSSISIAKPRPADAPRAPLRSAGIDLESAGNIDRIVIVARKRAVSVETGNLKAPMEALNNCTSDLLKEWGLDVEQHRSYQPVRLLNELEIARKIQAAYPARGGEAIFRLRAIVEPDGQMSDCVLLLAASTGSFNSTACSIMRDAKFEPARDNAGAPIKSYHSVVITYQIG